MDTTHDRVRDLLPDEYKGFDAQLRKKMEQSPEYANGGIPRRLWGMIGEVATKEIADAMDMNVFVLFAKGWCTAATIRKSALESRKTGKPITVTLAKHKATARVGTDVEVRIDPLPLRTIPFELELTAVFEPVRLGLKDGAIVKIWSGQCGIEMVLKMDGEPLHMPKKSQPVVLGAPLEFAAPGLLVLEAREESVT